MLKYFNKDKKKLPTIGNILTSDEFFNRAEFEIDTDFWKMNASQLEDVAKKQEKYIKHLKTLYTSQLDLLTEQQQQNFDEKKKLRTEIEELTIKNELNLNQKYEMEQQYKLLYESQTHTQGKQSTQSHDLLNMDELQAEQKEEELTKLKNQVAQVCEEMRRVQEENDDISLALDMEKQHKDSIIQQKNSTIESLNSQLQEATNRIGALKLELEKQSNIIQQLEDQVKASEQKIQVITEKQIAELENKCLQERIRFEQKSKDYNKCDECLTETKRQLELQSQDYAVLNGRTKILESKRQKDKQTISSLRQKLLQQPQETITVNQNQQTEIDLLTDQLNKEKLKVEQLFEQVEQSKAYMDQSILLSSLQNQLIELKDHIKLLEDQKSAIKIQLDEERQQLNKQIETLTIKRENAIAEINALNERVQQLMKLPQQQPAKQVVTVPSKKLFPYVQKLLSELRQNEDQCYKEFISLMIKLDSNTQEIICIERDLNEIVRRTQDIVDLLDEVGLR